MKNIFDDLEKTVPVFESFRIYNGKAFRLDDHLKRLRESANACGIEIPGSMLLKKKVLEKIEAEKIKEGFLRLNVRAGEIDFLPRELKKKPELKGVDLKTSSFRMPSPKEADAQAKTGNYRLQILETAGHQHEADKPFEWLFLDENHFITEARVGNFFIVQNGAVLTPPVRSVLNGITREVVIECARESGLTVREIPLTRHDAFNAREAFLTNSSWEILPVRSLDARVLKDPVPGPVTRKLSQCFHRKVQLECRPVKLNARLSQSRTKKV